MIDYMNKDYLYQESTEEFTEFILKNDKVYNITMIIQDKESTIDNLVNDILYSLEIN